MEQSLVEMKAQKLLLEAEKRATALQERQEGMGDEDEVASRAKKTGAAGLKGKAAKPKKYEGASKGKNYMDILWVGHQLEERGPFPVTAVVLIQGYPCRRLRPPAKGRS